MTIDTANATPAAGGAAADRPAVRRRCFAWYVQVEPDVIAEVEIDAAYEETARWRQPPRFLRLRTDMSVFDVPLADPPP